MDPKSSSYHFIQHAVQDKVGTQSEMGREKGILSFPHTTSNSTWHSARWECRVTLHCAVRCMKMTGDKINQH